MTGPAASSSAALGADETEGLTRCADGRLLYTEKGTGIVRALSDDGKDPVWSKACAIPLS
jgi:hypothetical protein